MQLSRMTILISAPVPARTGASLCESLQALACEICSCLCTCNCNHAAGSFSVRDLLFFAYATFSHATFSHGSISAPVPARTGASLCEIVRLLALACEIRSWLCKCNCNHAAGSFSVRDLLFFAYATFSHGSFSARSRTFFSARSRTCWNWLVSVRDCAITSSGLRNLLLSLYLGTSCNGL